jgi:hypothetical protein
VNEPYSSAIQAGKRVPHPQHWQALAKISSSSCRPPADLSVAFVEMTHSLESFWIPLVGMLFGAKMLKLPDA